MFDKRSTDVHTPGSVPCGAVGEHFARDVHRLREISSFVEWSDKNFAHVILTCGLYRVPPEKTPDRIVLGGLRERLDELQRRTSATGVEWGQAGFAECHTRKIAFSAEPHRGGPESVGIDVGHLKMSIDGAKPTAAPVVLFSQSLNTSSRSSCGRISTGHETVLKAPVSADAPADDVELEPLESVDGARRPSRVRLRGGDVLADGSVAAEVAAVTADRLALGAAAELVGLGERMLELTVDYVGVGQQSRQVFDSSWVRGEPAVFPLDGVIQGWQQGMLGMKEGGRRTLVIPAELAYGQSPPPGSGIAPGATLVFTVDLVSVD